MPSDSLASGPSHPEILSLLDEGVAIFDAEATLVATNTAFRAWNPALGPFLDPGTSWDLLLSEAARRGGLPASLCKQLRLAEDAGDAADPRGEPINAAFGDGRRFVFRLANLPDGGFVLIQSQGSAEADALREAEILLRKVLEASPTSLTMARVGDGRIIYRSPAATELLGTAKSSFAHFSNRSERADFVTALLPDARVDDMRFTGLRRDGAPFPGRISARLIDYAGEDVVVSNIEDLTEEIAVQTELAQNREQLFQAEKMSALGQLLAGVAHELNNPLSIIVGNLGILKDDLSGSGHVQRIDRLSAAAERCVGIVRSFLSMAREQPLELEPVEVEDIVAVALDASSGLAAGAGIEITFDAPEDVPTMLADSVQLAQVLINLITNAVHAMEGEDHGSRIAITAARSGTGRIVLKVADDGPGVPPEIRSRIFDPLFTTKPPGKGTGVGLAFCMRIVDSHGGRIRLAPPETSLSGATFLVEIPAAAT